ncbi:GGDEF domain-containing protein [Nakamurella sp. PAMC28650]|uniref:GGDEF domain-containing protein n=1 Tax=Nakamurella sp. PAMC28650 TaxID=2762325 RepID=UPI00164CE9CF|nr:GGDEF domain-containing protein [Nakamurella sp. PAMC28650]QNK80373.1 GGDEF domain-containing protein [Nakamurella sp. PAMC28650]
MSPSTENPKPRPRTPAVRAFPVYMTASLVGVVAYFLLPQAMQNVFFIVSNLVPMTVILIARQRRRLTPTAGWLLLAAFPAATGIGNAVYFVNSNLLHVDPFPSIGDGAFLGGYVLLAAGLLRLQRARTARRDLSAVVDAAIITVGFAAASWVFFMARLLHDPTSPLSERLIALGYPVADVLIVAVAARFFLGSRRRSPVFGWLAGLVAIMLIADTSFAVLNLLGLYHTGHPIDALILTYNLGWGAIALHRNAFDLTSPPSVAETRPSWRRLSALAAASLIAPTVLIVQVITHRLQDIAVTAGASALLFLLVVTRMAGLVRAVETVLTQRQELESQLEYRAQHDDLTGLANRRSFTERIERAMRHRPDGGVQVLFLDLDRFKAVNDSLGHGAGDQLLVVIARRLSAALRPGDTAARLGGDEFAVLLGDEPLDRSLDSFRTELGESVEQPVPLQGLDLRIAASIGTAIAEPGDTLEDLMHRADMAMYAQKGRIDRRTTAAP